MPGTAVVESGNYDLKIATGFQVNGFTLDSATKGILAGYTTTTTRTNLVTNPNFEVSTPNWDGSNPQSIVTTSTTQKYVGSQSLRIERTTSTGNLGCALPQSQINTPTLGIPVTAGITYTVSAYVYQTVAGTVDIDMNYQNGTTSIATNPVAFSPNVNTWTRITATVTAPPTANCLRIVIRFLSRPIGELAYVDAVLVEQASSALPYFDGTYADTYTGYTLELQAWNGTANASTSTATWGLTSSYIDSQYVLDGTTEFADVMDSTTNITVRRGRRDVGDQFSAGTMTFTIQDVDGIFNPFDENSPYYDTAESKPGLAPLRAVQLIRYSSTNVPESLFSGYVVNYDYNFALGGLDTVTVYCADQFYLLAQTYLDEFNPTAETSGQRIETVLDLPEVDFPAGSRSIATGTVNLGHDAAYTVPGGTNVLQYISQINETAEFGRLFMSRSGVLTFQDRIGTTFSAPTADFHDDGTGYKYDGVGISFEADSVVNRAVVTGLDGTTYTASNTTSIATYFIQTNSITNSLLHDATEIQEAAEYLLDPEPSPRYTSVATKFLMLTTAQKDTLATVEIGDTISIEKTFPSGAGTTELAQELSVEGIEHYLDFRTGHRVLYSTAPTTIVYELILDNATYGTLDTTNALG